MAEILAPCGSAESLEAALRCGADAVYLGGEMFSARQNATNFTDDELEKAVYECHKRKAKVYLAINTVITDQQLEQCLAMVRRACEMGVDGLITQDLALIEMPHSICTPAAISSCRNGGVCPRCIVYVRVRPVLYEFGYRLKKCKQRLVCTALPTSNDNCQR